ncbi:hypothetical protein Taro_050628, partial [Colocasia esculenta]|nr:hypothetical protein [Colocasia esculenta]
MWGPDAQPITALGCIKICSQPRAPGGRLQRPRRPPANRDWKEKLKSLKSAQPSSDDCTPHHVAARNDTYTQVLGPDRLGRVSGMGTGPTPTSMWGNESKEALRTENRLLMQRMEELETTMTEKFAKMESMIRGSQRSSETNRKNKGKQKWFHCAGTRSVADIHEEQ